MSNHPLRFETTVLYAWTETSAYGEQGIQLLRDGGLALVDSFLKVIRPVTLEEARALVQEHPPGPRGYSGFPPEAGWCLWAKDPNRQL